MNRTSIAFASVLLIAMAGGCTVTTTAPPPPPGGGGSCAQNNGVPCAAGASGWSCSGIAQPEDFNPDLVCSVDNGVGEFCCYSSPCSYDPSVPGCAGGTVGYSCGVGQPPPDATDPSLVCSEPTLAANADLYCCYTTTVVVAAGTCSQDFTVAGCVPGSYGFSCTGADAPDQDYSNLRCSAPTPAAGADLYCCTYH
jgi:hypothetical protein